jgi:hypothetical protein
MLFIRYSGSYLENPKEYAENIRADFGGTLEKLQKKGFAIMLWIYDRSLREIGEDTIPIDISTL